MPNLYSKLSAFGTFVHRNDPALIGYIVDNAIKIFGSERLMFWIEFPDREAMDRAFCADASASQCCGEARRVSRGEYLLEHRSTRLPDLMDVRELPLAAPHKHRLHAFLSLKIKPGLLAAVLAFLSKVKVIGVMIESWSNLRYGRKEYFGLS